MDTPPQHQDLKFCIKHNQPIILFDKQKNLNLCVLCVQEKTGMVSIDEVQKEQLEIQFKSDKEFQQEQQQLQILLDSIYNYKQKIINGIDKIIQIIIDQIKDIQQTQQKFSKQLQYSNEQDKFDQLKSQLKKQEDNHEQIKIKIKQLLTDFKSNYINADHLVEILTKSSQKIEKQIDHGTKSKIKIQEVKQDIILISGVFQYELIEESRIQVSGFCRSFAFNKDNSILIFGCYSKIKIYQFINGKIGKELQVLSYHKSDIFCLYFMKQSDCFVSGGGDNLIIIWKYENKIQWVPYQILTDHQKEVNCLLMNKNEDLLISGSKDGNVKFWKKNIDQWSCNQTIYTNGWVNAISFNEIENKLVFSGTEKYIQVIEIQDDNQWSLKQKINVDERGFGLCFTLEDEFIFQPLTKNYIEIYDQDSSLNYFKKQSQVLIQSCELCSILFPCKFIRSLNILLFKHGQYLNIFKVSENKDYKLIQTIQYKDFYLFGTVSDDGKYLVTWDYGSNQIQVRQLKIMNE